MIALGTWSSKGKKEAKQIAAAVLLETMLTSALINPDGVRRPPVASSLSETERERERVERLAAAGGVPTHTQQDVLARPLT